MQSKGLSALELLVIVVLLSLLSGLALPSLTRLLSATDLDSTTRLFQRAVSHSRHEAVRRNQYVVMKARDDWVRGWVVFLDHNRNARLDKDEPVLEDYRLKTRILIRGNSQFSRYIGFIGSGQSRQVSGAYLPGSIFFCSDTTARRLVINAGGRSRLETLSIEEACPMKTD